MSRELGNKPGERTMEERVGNPETLADFFLHSAVQRHYILSRMALEKWLYHKLTLYKAPKKILIGWWGFTIEDNGQTIAK